MSGVKKDLESLKNKLSELTDSEIKVEKINVRNNKELLNSRLKELKELQSQRVSINVGGKVYSFSARNLELTIFKGQKDVFYDGSPEYFNKIAEIIRHFGSSLNVEKFEVFLSLKDDYHIISSMLEEVYTENVEKVKEKIDFKREEVKKKSVTTTTEPEPEVVNANNDYNYQGGAHYNYDY